jgi:hypothetical protein
MNLAEALARLGRADEAVTLAEGSVLDPQASPSNVYDCACVVAVASASKNNHAADRHAARAVEMLRQSIAKGFADIPHLLVDDDLAPLRGRADYADLLWDLADTPAPVKP